MTRGGGREVKTQQVEPGGVVGVRGVKIFLSRRQEVLMTFNFCNQHLIWLPGRFCSVKQSMADDSYVKVKIVRWVWLMERQTLGMR